MENSLDELFSSSIESPDFNNKNAKYEDSLKLPNQNEVFMTASFGKEDFDFNRSLKQTLANSPGKISLKDFKGSDIDNEIKELLQK